MLISLLAFGTTSCNSSKIAQLETENIALKKQVDSLTDVIKTKNRNQQLTNEQAQKARDEAEFSAREAELRSKAAIEKAKETATKK